ncbi:MAG: DUF262 domain-containing protein [Patescibacteria group bacterium]|nr:DUF262 domain-containing protein [Patescibacteria group bacterium]
MEVEAFSLKISNVLSKGKFIIPDYQREYDWDESEIDELLEDLEDVKPDESYFIGHMVFEGKFTGNVFKVIDGQQRITTLTIMLCVIRDLFYTKGLNNLGDGINDKYIFGKDVDNNPFVILENKMPYPVLQSYVQSVPDKKDLTIKPTKSGEKKIIKAYEHFNSLFKNKSEQELKDIRDKILNLEVIFVAASDNVDAHSIFMTLNATGKDLTPIDLIKNQIFSLYPKQPHIDEPNDTWKKIIENVDENAIKFFNNFWSSRYKKISDSRLFKEFYKNIIKKKVPIKNFLSELLADSEIYRKINNPIENDWSLQNEYKIYLSLNAITNVFGIEVSNSMLISLIREYIKKDISQAFLIKALNIIEKFHFINNAICSNRSSGLDQFYSKASRELLNGQNKQSKHLVIDSFIQSLEEKIPSKDQFEVNFDSKLYFSSKSTKQRKLVYYVLNKIEFKKQNGNMKLHNMSIEHIYPESPKANVWKPLDEKYIINIGNLVLLDAGLNSKIGNADYKKKKKIILKKSNIISTKEVLENNGDWSEIQIKKRRDELVNLCFKDIWE